MVPLPLSNPTPTLAPDHLLGERNELGVYFLPSLYVVTQETPGNVSWSRFLNRVGRQSVIIPDPLPSPMSRHRVPKH